MAIKPVPSWWHISMLLSNALEFGGVGGGWLGRKGSFKLDGRQYSLIQVYTN